MDGFTGVDFKKGLSRFVQTLLDSSSKLVEVEPVFEPKPAPDVGQFTLEDVSFHSDASSCWIVIADKVYDVTDFLHTHPGGEEIILENAGSDATISFQSKGHSASAVDTMAKYCIGELVQASTRAINHNVNGLLVLCGLSRQ
ncbi:cytochrome b5-like isoform X2 [Dreissena polymorpha]|uniref:cytochrome b5-like isoform X1 n=1 Tax=Dreissena polymorpha TaxID=45954 RepID=UPI0022642900|nr:cytochrome b5-like isoform X1 [Dreissena polymorpha]XP_052232344.1 cytochrome b5-like isoform X2 [Dreissena polymorpha]